MSAEVVSSFFSNESTSQENGKISQDISEDFLHLIDELNISLEQFPMPAAVKYVYNPTIYARRTFEMYVRKYCNRKKRIMYFGMNPGPFGMSQTGLLISQGLMSSLKLEDSSLVTYSYLYQPACVDEPVCYKETQKLEVPFGEISSVRDWLEIEGPVGKPPQEVKTRPVNGFNCTRTEISGKRFWGLFKGICKTPDKFFETSFVYNYLNQQWMKSNGCNLTPSDFKVSEMEPLYNICDPTFIKVLELYEVEKIVAVGKFCESRAQKAVSKYCPHKSIKILYLPHPSPRTVNNNDWDKKAVEHLKKLNIIKYYVNEKPK